MAVGKRPSPSASPSDCVVLEARLDAIGATVKSRWGHGIDGSDVAALGRHAFIPTAVVIAARDFLHARFRGVPEPEALLAPPLNR